jgi:hypothetical protein
MRQYLEPFGETEIQTAAIGHFVGFVFWLCGLDLSGVEASFGGHISNRS